MADNERRWCTVTNPVDIVAAVLGYIRTLGEPGEEVRTAIKPWLMQTFGMDDAEAQRWRRRAMRELAGKIERINVRGPYVRILR